MTIQLNDVTSEQLEGLRTNFENIVISNGENPNRYDVSFNLDTEIDAWKLFFSGSDYTLIKFRTLR